MAADRVEQGTRLDKASLAGQLKIDRGAPTSSGGSPRLLWIGLAVVAVLLLAGGGIWFAIARPDLTPVQAATAKASGGGAAAGGSLLDASGYVVARRKATVSSKITGKVLEVNIEEGQHVAAGQVIARLDPSNAIAALDQAKAQAAAAQANLRLADVSLIEAGPKFQRMKQLHDKGWISDQGVETAQASLDTSKANLELVRRQAATSNAAVEVARRAVDDTVVRAPFAGVVTVKAAQPGEMVSPISAGGGFTRTGLGTIVDMDSLEVEVDVAESFINRVREGMPATVKLNAYPDWEIPAEALAVIPTADRSKATVTVRVGFKQKDPRIVPEMGARVAFLSPATPDKAAAPTSRSVLVPNDAVLEQQGGGAIAFVIDGGKARRRAVRLGAHSADGQVVLAGLRPGEQVAVGGLERLHDGAGIKITAAKPAATEN